MLEAFEIVFWRLTETFGFWLVPLFWIATGYCMGVIVHELGHALFGSLAGYPLKRVVIGEGPNLLRKRIVETEIDINAWPLSGRVEPWWCVNHGFWKEAFFSAGGLFGNLLFALLLIALYETPGLLTWQTSALSKMIVVQFGFVLFSVIPWWSGEDENGNPVGSDAYLFWQVWRDPSSDVTDAYDGLTRAYRPDASRARKPSRAASLIVSLLLFDDRKDSIAGRREVHAILERELGRGRMTPCEEAIVLERLIDDGFKINGLVDHVVLDRWSLRLLEIIPDRATIRGTRGAVLVTTGQTHEGRDVLLQVIRDAGASELDRMMSNIFLSRAALDLDDAAEARMYLGAAEVIAAPYGLADAPLSLIPDLRSQIAVCE